MCDKDPFALVMLRLLDKVTFSLLSLYIADLYFQYWNHSLQMGETWIQIQFVLCETHDSF